MTNATRVTNNMTLSKETNVHITKDTTIDYSIVEGVTIIGAFDNSYSISGDAKSLKDAKNNIITSVQDDFLRSPAAGYVRAEGVTSALDGNTSASGGNASSVANPFASPDTMKERIASDLLQVHRFGIIMTARTIIFKSPYMLPISYRIKEHRQPRLCLLGNHDIRQK